MAFSVSVRVDNSYGEGPPSLPQLASTVEEGGKTTTYPLLLGIGYVLIRITASWCILLYLTSSACVDTLCCEHAFTLIPAGPLAPSSVVVMSLNSSKLEVTWNNTSTPPNASRQSYTVRYHVTRTADLSQVGAWPSTSPRPQSPLSVVLENLKPFTSYSILVLATNGCGTDQSPVVMGITAESPPSPPTSLTVVAVLPTRIRVEWNSPTSPKGIITHYNVRTV